MMVDDKTFWTAADAMAKRLRLHLATIILLAAFASGVAAAVVRSITSDVRRDIAATRDEVRSLADAGRTKETADSLRFRVTMDVVELAVVALVEPAGSSDRKDALNQLRRRRRIAP